MAIYFDVKTIREITGDKYYRQPREFTLEELSQYDGSNGKPAYVAVEGIVYDVSNEGSWAGGTNLGLTAGKDYTSQFSSYNGNNKILSELPRVGILNHIFKSK
jgi:predicted heme/steroid binding protein